jgi:hypothetical protein
VRHLVAALVFGLLALSGTQGTPALATPTLIAGAAGAAGSAVLFFAFRPRVQKAARIAMTVAAVAVVGTGIARAPDGEDRAFVIVVAAVLAALLAAFALVSGVRRRPTPG